MLFVNFVVIFLFYLLSGKLDDVLPVCIITLTHCAIFFIKDGSDDLHPEFGKTGSRYESNVSSSYDCDVHGEIPPEFQFRVSGFKFQVVHYFVMCDRPHFG